MFNYCLVLLVLFSNIIFAQNVIWADKVIGFSSQEGTKKFSSNQILGEPSVMPDFGLSPCSWTPNVQTRKIEWIIVGFAEPIFASQIAINENNYPGAISQIILYDSLDKGYQVYGNNNNVPDRAEGRMLNIFFPKTTYRVKSAKILVNLINYIDKYQIDAVAISESVDSIKVKINTIKDIQNNKPEQLNDNINSKSAELAPVISADGKSLYFTRDGHPDNIGVEKKQDVWFSVVDSNGIFQKAVNLGLPINNSGSNFAISITQDGNGLFLGNKYLEDGTLKPGFSISYKSGNLWVFPDSIRIKRYFNYSKSGSYCLASNGKVMLFAINREDTYGDNDLYVSFLENDGSWSEPRNLGSKVNTADEEISPFLAADGKTLYYSTAGKPGYGLHDMFVTTRLDDSWANWSKPVNLGENLNSDGWDAYYTIPANGEYAYFVANLNDEKREDIFRIKLPEQVKPQAVVLISGKVLNQKTNQPLAATIIYETLPGGKSAGVARSNPETGEYKIALPAGSNYGFLAQAAGFIAVNENIDLKNTDKYKEINQDLYLVPIEKGQKIKINNIFFEYAKYDLLPESYSELDRIVEFLKSKPNVKIKIEGHTDNIGTVSFNSNLSKERANSVKNYLSDKGIELSRIIANGLGSLMPIGSNETEDGRKRNRRVEMTIIEN